MTLPPRMRSDAQCPTYTCKRTYAVKSLSTKSNGEGGFEANRDSEGPWREEGLISRSNELAARTRARHARLPTANLGHRLPAIMTPVMSVQDLQACTGVLSRTRLMQPAQPL